jgi:hypothetical protein
MRDQSWGDSLVRPVQRPFDLRDRDFWEPIEGAVGLCGAGRGLDQFPWWFSKLFNRLPEGTWLTGGWDLKSPDAFGKRIAVSLGD